ncbi:MAG: FAD-dependent oxidoreductase [Desulfarculales bacterium]|jgi:electron transfer flavoprotein-quinone oxidoreductase|nr:FAD-dependent oxidoreductase [Desulfarculales bacterium]
MADDSFEAIVVGAGPAGSAAAYTLAAAGLEVLMVERGINPGDKSMSGGRIYAYSLARLWPAYADSAPLERRITRETISLVDGDSMVDFSVCSPDFLAQDRISYTVLRQEFDAWAARQAENAGASLIAPVNADGFYRQNGRLAGITAGGENVKGKVIVLAEGANGLLAQEAGLRREFTPRQAAVGFKEIIKMPAEIIQERFNLLPGQGAARLLAGSLTGGLPASGAFIYTNKDSLSLGMVISLKSAMTGPEPVHRLLERFKNHPAIRPLLQGGETVEYSAHLVPEASYYTLKPTLAGDNILLAGDAAGMVINHGYTVRGMDLALLAGQAAGLAILQCRGDYRAKTLLPAYEGQLRRAGVLGHLKAARHMPAFLENPRITGDYPALAVNLAKDIFSFDGSPPRPLFRGKLWPRLRGIGVPALLKDAWLALRALG